MGEQAESIGITLEVYDVLPLPGRDAIARLRANVILQEQPAAFTKVGSYSRLATMTEGRVAHVVSKAGGRDDVAQFCEMRTVELRVILQDESADVVAQAAPHTADLEAMRQPVVHEDAARQGKDLRLVLQTPEGGRENQAVVVALEFRTVVALLSSAFQSQALAAQKLCPIHILYNVWGLEADLMPNWVQRYIKVSCFVL